MSSTETGERLLFRFFLVGTAKRVTSETGHTKASANPTGDQIHASCLSPQRLTCDLRDACGRAVSLPRNLKLLLMRGFTLWVDKYGTGSGSDRVWSNQTRVPAKHGPGRYRFRFCNRLMLLPRFPRPFV